MKALLKKFVWLLMCSSACALLLKIANVFIERGYVSGGGRRFPYFEISRATDPGGYYLTIALLWVIALAVAIGGIAPLFATGKKERELVSYLDERVFAVHPNKELGPFLFIFIAFFVILGLSLAFFKVSSRM